MIRILLAVLLLAAAAASAQKMPAADRAWEDRNSLAGPAGTNFFAVYRDLSRNRPDDPSSWWKYSRALNFYGMYLVSDNARKKDLFLKAKDAALRATMLAPDDLDGRLWLAVSLGNWGQANGVLNSLSVIPDIEQNMNEVLTRDPGRDAAAAYTVLGRLYYKAPPRPLSVGDAAKAESYLKSAIELVPAKIKNYHYLAELYYEGKRNEEALRIADKALALAPRPCCTLEDRFDQNELKVLREKILARIKK